MSDKLERYIKENRKSFDDVEPPINLWNDIETCLDEKSKPKKGFNWMIAASISLLFVLFAGYQFLGFNKHSDIVKMDNEFVRKENQFVNLIEQRKDSLNIFKNENPKLYQQFVDDLQKLDNDYEKLKKELLSSPNKPMVLKAIVKNREAQMQLLRTQLDVFLSLDVQQGAFLKEI